MIPTFSPEIRRILLNFLTRRWLSLVWIGSFYLLASFAVVKALADDPESKLNSARFIFPMSVSFWLVLIDVSAKPIRSLLALPVTANSLWNSYWWLTFGLPAIAFTLISILGLAGAWMTGPLALPFDKVLILYFEQWGALALGWCCLSLLPSGDDVTKHRPISSTIAGAFRGLQMALFVFVIPNSFLWQSIILGVSGCTIVVALFGKRLTGQFILERIGRPDYPFKPVSSRRSRDKATGPLGWMVLVPLFARGLAGMLCGLAFFVVIDYLRSSMMNSKTVNDLHSYLTSSLMGLILVGASLPLSRTLVDAIRVVRQLPMSASSLSMIFLLSACLPYLLVNLAYVFVVLAFQADSSGLWCQKSVLSLTPLAFSVCFPAMLLHARSDGWRLLSLIICLGGPLIAVSYVIGIAFGGTTPRLFLVAIVGASAFFWTRWEISSGRTGYQIEPVTNTGLIST